MSFFCNGLPLTATLNFPSFACVVLVLCLPLQVLKAVGNADEQSGGVVMDALAALEKTMPLGFDYRDVSMPVHVFHGRADHMVSGMITMSEGETR